MFVKCTFIKLNAKTADLLNCYISGCKLIEYLLGVYRKDVDTQQHLNPEQLDVNDECIFHLIAKVKRCSDHVLNLTKMLGTERISARYVNKKEELPTDILRQLDPRRQCIKRAESLEPSTKQSLSETSSSKKKECYDNRSEIIRKKEQSVKSTEVVINLSEKEVRKKRIMDMIECLPNTKHSLVTGDSEKRRDATPIVKIIPEIVAVPENTDTDVVDEEVDKTTAEDSSGNRCEDDAFGMDSTVCITKYSRFYSF